MLLWLLRISQSLMLQNPVSLRDISLRQGISLLYLEQIFLKLKKNNIVK